MLTFAAIGGAWAVGVVALLGGYALFRGQRRGRAVSSVKLWRGLAQADAGKRARRVDPVWLLVWVAALLAALGLMRPQWRRGAAAEDGIDLAWAVRDTAAGTGRHVEGWAKLVAGEVSKGAALVVRVPGSERVMPLEDAALRRGLAFAIADGALPPRVELAVTEKGRTRARRTFEPELTPAFGWTCLPGRAAVDAALERFFRLHPSGRANDPTIAPAVLLLGPGADAATLEPQREVALMIADRASAVDGVTPGGFHDNAPPDGWLVEATAALAGSVRLERVRVRAYQAARLSPEWQVLATIGGTRDPWIARRSLASGGDMIWLAARPTGDTDWAGDTSFVIFWAEAVNAAVRRGDALTGEWRPLPRAASQPSAEITPVDLRPLTGITAMGLLLAASGALWQRLRRSRTAVLS